MFHCPVFLVKQLVCSSQHPRRSHTWQAVKFETSARSSHTRLLLLAPSGSCMTCSSVPRTSCKLERGSGALMWLRFRFAVLVFLEHKIKKQAAEQCVCVCMGVRMCAHTCAYQLLGHFPETTALQWPQAPLKLTKLLQGYVPRSGHGANRRRPLLEAGPLGAASKTSPAVGMSALLLLPAASFCCPYSDLGSSLSGSRTV